MIPPRQPLIVDSTLREGEQHPGIHWSSSDRLVIAEALDALGVDLIEMPSPAVSAVVADDLRLIAGRGFAARVAAHVRCIPAELQAAVDCGAQILHVYLGSSPQLRLNGHGRDWPRMFELVREAGDVVRRTGVPARFSCEDAFRTPLPDLARIFQVAEDAGFERIGLADTIGVATPDQVRETVAVMRHVLRCDIEFHGHNDSGCAVANTHAAFRAGATHLDTTVLGIGERNGIAPLGDLLARLWLDDRGIGERYRLELLPAIADLVAGLAGIPVPHTACVGSRHAFTHKAGPHVKAVISDPSSYEALPPEVFGRTRRIEVAHRLVGHHAIAHRAEHLGLDLSAEGLRAATQAAKELADRGGLDEIALDALLIERARVERENVHGQLG
ncbi:MAG: homocitrate synthase [Planctomycetes bacterium]|nr:homocitrate synthase [Planctomycetota bacterium]